MLKLMSFLCTAFIALPTFLLADNYKVGPTSSGTYWNVAATSQSIKLLDTNAKNMKPGTTVAQTSKNWKIMFTQEQGCGSRDLVLTVAKNFKKATISGPKSDCRGGTFKQNLKVKKY